MLTLETSAGTEQAIGLLNKPALQRGDHAGVIGVNGRNTRVLQSLTDDREALASALQRAGFRIGVGIGGAQIDASLTVDLVTSITKACEELKRSGLTESKRAVVVLFGSEDPELRSQLAVLKAVLTSTDTRLYAVVIDRSANERAIPPGRVVRTLHPFPALTAQLVSELAEYSGGRIFRSAWDLREILKEIRKP
jgi:hypothetical protein